MAERGKIGDKWRVAEQGGRMASQGDEANKPTTVGARPLGLGSGRDGLVYVPAGYDPKQPAPLVVMLHGAGGNARDATGLLRQLADELGFLLLVPESRGRTWDVILGGFGPDVAFIERALELVFQRYSVDLFHVAIAGFSDGASYALSLGLGNGDLFNHVIAFAPGFLAPTEWTGKPRVFVSHGTKDTVLPIHRCSRVIVPQLQRAGYEVTYQEFEGPHTVPPEVGLQAVLWFKG